ncbi:MAG: SRPBCC family protein, partial [Anaerolineae bacterium]|nr:SRPBCC family protein [Anaerolineae bacterium]
MIKIEQSIVINRPVEDVFVYVTDNSKTAEWQSGLKESTVVSEGPLAVGSIIKDIRTLAGMEMDSTVEVTAFERNKKFGLKVQSGPVPFELIQTFEAVEG